LTRAVARLAALALLLTSPACRTPYSKDAAGGGVVGSFYREPADGRQIRRVVLLPFRNETPFPDDSEMIREALAKQLTMRGRFEVIPLPGEVRDLERFEEARPAGTFGKKTLLEAHRRFKADAVLFGTVTRYHPYEPIVLGLKLDLVNTGAGDVVWSAEALFDASLGWIAQDVEAFYCETLRETDSLEGWRSLLASSRLFADYACHRIAASLP
jgi:hypothetical protein